jgi:hypothetical protein
MFKIFEIFSSIGQRAQGVPKLAKGYIPGTNAGWSPAFEEPDPKKLPKGGSSIVPPPQANNGKAK